MNAEQIPQPSQLTRRTVLQVAAAAAVGLPAAKLLAASDCPAAGQPPVGLEPASDLWFEGLLCYRPGQAMPYVWRPMQSAPYGHPWLALTCRRTMYDEPVLFGAFGRGESELKVFSIVAVQDDLLVVRPPEPSDRRPFVTAIYGDGSPWQAERPLPFTFYVSPLRDAARVPGLSLVVAHPTKRRSLVVPVVPEPAMWSENLADSCAHAPGAVDIACGIATDLWARGFVTADGG